MARKCLVIMRRQLVAVRTLLTSCYVCLSRAAMLRHPIMHALDQSIDTPSSIEAPQCLAFISHIVHSSEASLYNVSLLGALQTLNLMLSMLKMCASRRYPLEGFIHGCSRGLCI